MTESRAMRRLNFVMNAAVLLVASWFIIRAGSPLRAKIREVRNERGIRAVLAEVWPTLVSGPRIDSLGSGVPVVVEFGDYECPACRQYHRIMDTATREAGVGIVYRHYPITATHPAAELGAKAAICAESQQRFREMHEHLLSDDEWRKSGALFGAIAAVVGVPDTTLFKSCLDDPATAHRLAEDLAVAARLNIKGSPTFVGRSQVYLGIAPAPILRNLAVTK